MAGVIPFPARQRYRASAGRRRLAPTLLWSIVLFAAGFLVPWLLADRPGSGSHATVGAEIAGRATIIDGDTIEIRGERIRLHGIDAPESGQSCQRGSGEVYRCGQVAALALDGKIGSQSVRCDLIDRDRYDRHIGRCFIGQTDLNAWMVRQGHAVAYRRYALDYVPMETEARAERNGAWEGYFDLPWDWRSGDRRVEAGNRREVRMSSAGCDIKGNISRNGRIYHLPGQRFYDRTVIDQATGERWFCSEEEARAAGWRRALQ